jgi:hypothetical protein
MLIDKMGAYCGRQPDVRHEVVTLEKITPDNLPRNETDPNDGEARQWYHQDFCKRIRSYRAGVFSGVQPKRYGCSGFKVAENGITFDLIQKEMPEFEVNLKVTLSGLCKITIKPVKESGKRFALSEEDPVILGNNCHSSTCVTSENDETFSVQTAAS